MPNTNEKDGELGRDRMLWDIGVVVEDGVILDEILEVVKDGW
jgi:hypothetical protein